MANHVNVRLSGNAPRANIAPSLTAGNAHSYLPSFLRTLGEAIGTYPIGLVHILNDDATAANDNVTVSHSNMNDGDTIQIGSMILTAKGASGPFNLGLAESFAVLGTTVTGSAGGGTVVNGDLGYTTHTNFPPSTVTGVDHAGDATTIQARTDAQALYTAQAAHAGYSTIASALDGQTLTAGYYSFASGAATLAESGNGTLTLSGSASDTIVIKTATTLRTGAGGIPTITLTGGITAENVLWLVGSSATVNIGATSFGAIFRGTIIAQSAITDTQGGATNGRYICATITFSGAGGAGSITKPTGGSVTPGANQFLIGTTDAATALNLAIAISANSSGLLSASANAAVVTATSTVTGPLGNMIAVIITQLAAGMVATTASFTGGANDTAPIRTYQSF